MNKGLSVAAVAVAGVVALTACDTSSGTGSTTYYKNGKAGQVVDRDIEDGHYELEVKDSKGRKHEFNVYGSVYNDCHLYSFYPSCVNHKNNNQSVTPSWKKNHPTKKTNKNKTSKSNKGTKSKSKGFSFGGSSKNKRR